MSSETGVPGQRVPAGRRVMSTGTCVCLLVAGAVFRFALPAGSPLGLNLRVVGVILFAAGLLGLILPPLARARPNSDRLRRWVIPSGSTGLGAGPAGGNQDDYEDVPPMVADLSMEPGRPTFADDLVSAEQDPPL